MALFRIDKFVGVNVNVESGEGVTSPTSVKGFLFDRTGGLVARYGDKLTQSVDRGSVGALGYSPDGLALSSASSAAYLYDGTNAYTGSAAAGSFIPTIGTADLSKAFLIKDKDGTVRTSTTFSATAMLSPSSTSTLTPGLWAVALAPYYPTLQGALFCDIRHPTVLSVTSGDAIKVTVTTAPTGAKLMAFYGKARAGTTVGGTAPFPYTYTDSASFAGVVSATPMFIGDDVGSPSFTQNLAYYLPEWTVAPNAEVHNKRIWGVTTRTRAVGINQVFGEAVPPSPQDFSTTRTIMYTEIGYPNAMLLNNWLDIPFRQSASVTGLRSSPAGLLVFGQNETFLIRGDPANASSFSVQLVSGEIGHDSGAEQPGVLGGAVFCIYNGRIYELMLGMGDVDFGTGIKEIGYNVWDGSDGFVQVVGEPRRNQLVARTASGKIYRYDLHEKQWFNDPLTGRALWRMIPNPDSLGTRYVESDTGLGVSWVTSGVPAAAAASPSVSWTGLDMGDRGIKKHWRRVRIFTGDSYSGTPTLTYSISGSSGTISGTDNGGGRFVFVLPQGLVGERGDLTVALAGASAGDQLKAPVEVEFNARYRQR